ncbi:PaaI family thioesterase [Candidatus Solincola sp.]|nr:PaaI family thioesterase [Actinomycetota bacterium]MDI7252590.1 PaaI family thioesterase [Actinomycetota bacterium]
MEDRESRYERIIRLRSDPSTFYALLGMRVEELEEGRSRLTLPVEKKHLNAGGVVHGGALASLADASIAAALATLMDLEREGMITVEMKINYLAPVRDGQVSAEGKVIQKGKSIAVGEACLYGSGGRMVAKATATFMIRQRN